MFTRVVELTGKHGKRNELCTTLDEKVLPLLKKQQGFQDQIVLVSNTDPNQVRVLSFWNRREDAERYHREQFSRVTEMIQNFCDGAPEIATHDVNTSTVHHINRGKAA